MSGATPGRDDVALLAWLGDPPQGAELELLRAVAKSLVAGPADPVGPAASPAGESAGSLADENEMLAWGIERTVRADVIRRLLIDDHSPAAGRGVRLRNLRISGRFDLRGSDCTVPLCLDHCYLDADEPVDLDFATLAVLLITRCLVSGLSGSCLEVKKSADFSQTRFTGPVSLPNASIGDNLDFSGTRMEIGVHGGGVLDLDAITVGGRLRLNAGFQAVSVGLRAARLAANLNCRQGTLSGQGAALSAEHAEIKGDVLLNPLIVPNGQVFLRDANVAGNLSCDGARLGSASGVSLDGEALKVGGALRLRGGMTASGTIKLTRSTLSGNLNCRKSHLNGSGYSLDCWRAKISGDVLMDPVVGAPAENGPCVCAGAVRLEEARIDGNLRCGAAQLKGTVDGQSVAANSLTVGGSVTFIGGFVAAGTISLRSAGIGGDLWCRGCRLDGAGIAINAERLKVGGDVLIDTTAELPGLRATGAVWLFAARIAGHLDCGGATIGAAGQPAFSVMADLISVGARVRMNAGFSAAGTVWMRGATIGAELDCSGAHLMGAECSLGIDQTVVTGDVILGVVDGDQPQVLESASAVSLDRAKIGADLDARGAQINGANGHGNGLYADGVVVGRNARLSDGFVAEGGVWLRGAAIGGDLDCRDSRIRGRERGLNVEQARIGGDMRIDRGVVRQRGSQAGRRAPLAMTGARISGSLTASRARILATDPQLRAVDADAASVGVSARLTDGFRARGIAWLGGATVGADLDCGGARVQSLLADGAKIGGDLCLTGALTVRDAITLRQAQVSGTLRWEPTVPATGPVDLEGCSVHTLEDNWAGARAAANGHWPTGGRLRLDGLTYVVLDGGAGDGAKRRLGWVRSQYQPRPADGAVEVDADPSPTFASQPYEELTNFYQGAGQDSDARLMAINRRRDRRMYGDLRNFRRVGSWLLDVSIAYGYATWRALAYLAVIYAVVLGFSIYAGDHPGTMVPAQSTAGITPSPSTASCTSKYPCFSPVGYAIDTVVPLINIHQASSWQPNADAPSGWLFVWVGWAGTILGYALATLAIAGYTGLVRSGDGS
jgi:hypothetical protein